jgi:class 3 adenylate cyclase/pimeloyl-ACP methyl ester carboxylesterase
VAGRAFGHHAVMPSGPPEIRYAKSGDVHVAYTTSGGSDLDLVHVPGILASLEAGWQDERFARFHEALAGFSRLVTFDKRGTGLSDRLAPGATPSLEDRTDDIRAVMDAVDSERAVIMGIADGGPVAMVFAATHPERTRALVLSATAARRTRAPDHPWGDPPDQVGRRLDEVERLWGTGVSAQFFEHIERRVVARLEQLAGTPAAARAVLELSFRTDVSDVLGAISAPTLIVHHTDHLLWPVEGARYLARGIPGARLVELPGRPTTLYGAGIDNLTFAGLIEEFVTGRRHVPEVDRILKTVLFTDIARSTERLAEMGDHRWREVLEEFRRRVRMELEQYRGEEVNTRGDDVLAAFDGPARALRCATAIQASASSLGLEVRAGVHTGEVEVHSGDITGIAVHVGARVAAAARPGEVLTTTTVRDLVAGSGIEFSDRGTHLLKGVPGEWHLLAAHT